MNQYKKKKRKHYRNRNCKNQLNRQNKKFFKKILSEHHIRPRSRFGCDEKWNIYPWNTNAHSAYHVLFGDSILSEILEGKLENLYKEIFNNQYNDSRMKELVNKKRRFWIKTFEDETFYNALKVLKKIMWWNLFTDLKIEEIIEEKKFNKIIAEIKNNPDRKWAFEKLFNCSIHQIPENLENIINNIYNDLFNEN